MKQIETLVSDIEKVFTEPHEFKEGNVERFGQRLAKAISYKINQENDAHPRLRMSNLGTKCDRKLWYSINKPHLGEGLPASARMKFLFGHILEEVLLFLAEEAGHTVEGAQDELELHGVLGHRDAIVDGVLIDAKSASSFSYKKFQKGLTKAEDGFGYLTQLQAYLAASKGGSTKLDESRAGFLVIDKQLGHIHLDMHPADKDTDFKKLIEYKKEIVASPKLPNRGYDDEPEGKSGNKKLCMECSYCQFKSACWPGLRTFIYSKGPVYLTKVVRQPDVPET